MYLPAHFAVTDTARLHRLIQANPLGALVRQGPAGLDADHLPFQLDPTDGPWGSLSGHVARANPLWQQCADGSPVLVIFRGAQAFISPSWYPSKQATHRQVPTWNYEVVHAHGTISIHDDERHVRGVVARLTRQHEAGEPQPWRMGDASPDHIETLLRQIVGIRIAITALEGKSKLSQNKSPADRLSAADTLDARGQPALAQAMRDAADPAA